MPKTKEIRAEIEHVKLLEPTKARLSKIMKSIEKEVKTGITMVIPDCFYLDGLKLSQTGRQLIKKYKSKYLVNTKTFIDAGFDVSKEAKKVLKEVFQNGAFLSKTIKDQISHPKLCLSTDDYLQNLCEINSVSVYIWDMHKDFKNYKFPLTHNFQGQETKYINTDEQLKTIQKYIKGEHYFKTLKKLPDGQFIEVEYF